MNKFEKSLAALDAFLEETSVEELMEIHRSVGRPKKKGITVKEYLNRTKSAIKVRVPEELLWANSGEPFVPRSRYSLLPTDIDPKLMGSFFYTPIWRNIAA